MKPYITAAFVASLTFGGFVAIAASLGGLTTDNLGADNSAVAACDTDGVTTTYTISYDATDARHEVATTDVGGVAGGCVGQTVTVTLTNAAGTALDTSSATAASPTTSVNTTTAPDAEAVANIHVVITG